MTPWGGAQGAVGTSGTDAETFRGKTLANSLETKDGPGADYLGTYFCFSGVRRLGRSRATLSSEGELSEFVCPRHGPDWDENLGRVPVCQGARGK